MQKLIRLTSLGIFWISMVQADHCYYKYQNTELIEEVYYVHKYVMKHLCLQLGRILILIKRIGMMGFGYYDSCNSDKPLARIMSALWALKHTAPMPGKKGTLGFYYNYAANFIDELDGRCYAPDGDKSTTATSLVSPVWVGDEYTELYWSFFYDIVDVNNNVLTRGNILAHEARHTSDLPALTMHFTTGCPSDACDVSWGQKGAYMYDTVYLLQFYQEAVNSTSAMRLKAGKFAQWSIDNRFIEHPGFEVIF